MQNLSHPGTTPVSLFFAVTLGAFFVLSGAYKLWRGFGTTGLESGARKITGNFLFETEEEHEDEDRPMSTTWHSFTPAARDVLVLGPRKGVQCDCLQEGLFRLPFKFLAQKRVEDYRVGQTVTAYVSPRDPTLAVLRRGPPIDAYVLFVSGIVLLLLGWKFW